MDRKISIAIGSDHAAMNLKKAAADYLTARGLEYKDFGAYEVNPEIDYPEYAQAVAEAVAAGEYTYGIILCGTGVGVAIAANKVRGIRAANCSDVFTAKACRRHNDANILTMGERVVGTGLAIEILEAFLSAEFEGGRHARRVGKITAIEDKYCK